MLVHRVPDPQGTDRLQPHLLSLTYLFLLLFVVLDPNFSFPIVGWSHASDTLIEV
jgi:hypothetical protein